MSCFERQNAATATALPNFPWKGQHNRHSDLHKADKQTVTLSDLKGKKKHPRCHTWWHPPGQDQWASISDMGTPSFWVCPSHSVCWKFGEDCQGVGNSWNRKLSMESVTRVRGQQLSLQKVRCWVTLLRDRLYQVGITFLRQVGLLLAK